MRRRRRRIVEDQIIITPQAVMMWMFRTYPAGLDPEVIKTLDVIVESWIDTLADVVPGGMPAIEELKAYRESTKGAVA